MIDRRTATTPHDVALRPPAEPRTNIDDQLQYLSVNNMKPIVPEGETWKSIPEYLRTDLLVGKHLGKGTFSDVFEITAMKEKCSVTRETNDIYSPPGNTQLASASLTEGTLASAPLKETAPKVIEEEGDDLDREIDAIFALTSVNQPSRTAANRSNSASICSGALQTSSRPSSSKKRQVTYAMNRGDRGRPIQISTQFFSNFFSNILCHRSN